jgi:prepilin-type N-terminal cleavage/methylation domain-containing protein
MSVVRRRVAWGFTLLELIVVLTIVGIALAVVVPRFRLSPSQRVAADAQQVLRDLELARTRALATRRSAQMVFDVAGNRYTGYLDDNGDGTFLQSASEMQALRGRGPVGLSPEVSFGRGGATALPGDTAATAAVTFQNNRVTFGPSGVTTPFGARGTVYLRNKQDQQVVAAVSVTGAGSFKLWRYNKDAGAWQ